MPKRKIWVRLVVIKQEGRSKWVVKYLLPKTCEYPIYAGEFLTLPNAVDWIGHNLDGYEGLSINSLEV